MKSFIALLVIVAGFTLSSSAQQPVKKSEEIRIKTSAVCGMCKNTIESALYKVQGVVSAAVDVDSKIVTVVFKPSKTNAAVIRQTIAAAGYDADDVAADSTAYDQLHGCCKKE